MSRTQLPALLPAVGASVAPLRADEVWDVVGSDGGSDGWGAPCCVVGAVDSVAVGASLGTTSGVARDDSDGVADSELDGVALLLGVDFFDGAVAGFCGLLACSIVVPWPPEMA